MDMKVNSSTWTDVCSKDDLTANGGICAQLNEYQVAIFFCKRTGNLYAIDNFDPFGQANVLSRGLIGSTGEITYVASPLLKQRFNLATGECLDSDAHKLKTFDVRLEGDTVQLKEAS